MNKPEPWFAVQTKPRNEQRIEYLLRQKGYDCFLPMYRQKRRWSDRTAEIEMPLFPLYIFCQLNSSVLGKVVTTPGVTRIVGFGGKPAPVATEEIEALHMLMQSNYLRRPWHYLPGGTQVVVESGPLAGVQGIICPDGDRRRLIISIALLQRSVAIQLDEYTVISVAADVQVKRPQLKTDAEIAVALLRK